MAKKWLLMLLTLLVGMLLGAVGLFAYLRQVAQAVPDSAVHTRTGPAAPSGLTGADVPPRPGGPDIAPTNNIATDAVPPADQSRIRLLIPVEGVKLAELLDTFDQPRGKERQHGALDIMAPRGRKVIAAADGKVVKLFNSTPGGLSVYQFDPGEQYAYYYAHLERYADGLKEGSVLRRGDPVGYVGSSGNADPAAPHLHFAVIELTPARQWWSGTPRNPYPMMSESGVGAGGR